MGSPAELTADPLLAWRTPRNKLVTGIRVAPHFYITDEELEYTVNEIRSIVSARVHA